MPHFPINDIVQSATIRELDARGQVIRIYFHGDGDRLKSSQFPQSLEAKVRAALGAYNISPTIGHIDTHDKRNGPRIELVITPEQHQAAAIAFTANAEAELQKITGVKFTYSDERNGYFSSEIPRDKESAIRASITEAGIQDFQTHTHGSTDAGFNKLAREQGEPITGTNSAIFEIGKGAVGYWLARRAQPKHAEQVTASPEGATKRGR